MILLYGLKVESSDKKVAAAVLGQEVSALITQVENIPSTGARQGQQMNILGAVAAIGLRNPQTLLLVKAGGAVFASQKVRRDFTQQLITQVEQNLGSAPRSATCQHPRGLRQRSDRRHAPLAGGREGNGGLDPATDDTDLIELPAEEVSAIETPEPVSESAIEEPAPVFTETQVRPSTEAELAAADGATAKGARLELPAPSSVPIPVLRVKRRKDQRKP